MILVAVVVILLLLLFILMWLQLRAKPQTGPSSTGVIEETEPAPTRGQKEERTVPILVSEEEQIKQASLESLAQTFTERYGSYSGESDFGNVKDVLPLMSAAFAARSEAMIASGSSSSGGYYGMTTNVLNVTVDAMDETAGVAVVSVNTQRVEATGSAQNTEVSYQTLVLDFVREDDAWKVDAANWGE